MEIEHVSIYPDPAFKVVAYRYNYAGQAWDLLATKTCATIGKARTTAAEYQRKYHIAVLHDYTA
jgi:hypothetical protein